MKIASWNVNGLRAIFKKEALLIFENDFDLIGLQETKASVSDLSKKILSYNGYKSYFSSAVKKGYSGVGFYYKNEPENITNLGENEFDKEGRGLIFHYRNYVIINCYFPNSQAEAKRLDYKISFLNFIQNKCQEFVLKNKNVILFGDYNVAPKPIDLTNPKTNEGNPGYLPEEREWMDNFSYKDNSEFIDVFRHFYPDEIKYTWWSYRNLSRPKNIGWRIDHFCVNKNFINNILKIDILDSIYGSDHCPVMIELRD